MKIQTLGGPLQLAVMLVICNYFFLFNVLKKLTDFLLSFLLTFNTVENLKCAVFKLIEKSAKFMMVFRGNMLYTV